MKPHFLQLDETPAVVLHSSARGFFCRRPAIFEGLAVLPELAAPERQTFFLRKHIMTSAELQRIQKRLQRERDHLLVTLQRLAAETRDCDPEDPQDVGDFCLNSISKENLFQQRSQVQGRLRMIESALSRIDEGSFGTCQSCAGEIPDRRLEVLPWASNCIRCQELLEQRHLDRSPAPSPFSPTSHTAM